VRGHRPDEEIKAEIQRYLQLNYWLDASLNNIAVQGGRVTLDGRLGSAQKKEHAAGLVWIGGVSAVVKSGLTVDHTIADKIQRSIDSMAQSDKLCFNDSVLLQPASSE
jgi:hypothetical protein